MVTGQRSEPSHKGFQPNKAPKLAMLFGSGPTETDSWSFQGLDLLTRCVS